MSLYNLRLFKLGLPRGRLRDQHVGTDLGSDLGGGQGGNL